MRYSRLAIGLAGVLAGSSSAHAAPCAVTVDAPDDARVAIATWIAAEPACGPALAVHVVRTAGGFEITASDPTGRRFERVAPDAQTAAALVASWAADDPIAHAVPAPAPAADTALAVAAVAVPSEPASVPRWGMLGAVVGREYGVRAEAELLVHGRWSFGLAVTAQTGMLRVYGAERDGRLLETAGVEADWRGWNVRAALGAGVQITSLRMSNMPGATGEVWGTGSGTLFAAEASVMLRHELGAGWSVALGGLVTVLPLSTISFDGMSVVEDVGRVAPSGVIGVGYRW